MIKYTTARTVIKCTKATEDILFPPVGNTFFSCYGTKEINTTRILIAFLLQAFRQK